jgi:prepilin-type N-terminal cleavage/methylation domain-containing protein
MTYKPRKLNQETGFTIVELLVATAVLSVVLTLVTVVIVGIGNLYYKGVNTARVQDNVRSLTDEISQKLQLQDGKSFSFNSPVPPNIVYTMCVGTTRYNFVLNRQMGTPGVEHVLWRDNVPIGSCTVDNSFWSNASLTGGTELIAPRSRLTSFKVVQQSSSFYIISIGVAYGDGDLLCNLTVGSGAGSDCSLATDETDVAHAAALTTIANPSDIVCRSHHGNEYCATASLETTVIKRL